MTAGFGGTLQLIAADCAGNGFRVFRWRYLVRLGLFCCFGRGDDLGSLGGCQLNAGVGVC